MNQNQEQLGFWARKEQKQYHQCRQNESGPMCKVQCPHLLPEAELSLPQSRQEYLLFPMVLLHHRFEMIQILVFLATTAVALAAHDRLAQMTLV